MTNSLLPIESRRAYADFSTIQTDLPFPIGEIWSEFIAVQEICPPNSCYSPAPLGGLTLFLTHQGQTQLEVGASRVLHQRGSLAAIASGSQIKEIVAQDEAWSVSYIQFQGRWAEQMNAWLRDDGTSLAIWNPLASRPRQLFLEMLDLIFSQPTGWTWLFVSRSAELFGELCSKQIDHSEVQSLAKQIALRLEAYPAERLTLAEMAAFVDLTPRQLLYRFHKTTGEPLAQWMRIRRMRMAQQRLGQGQTVTEVSDALGFANPYHFSRIFRGITGVSPSVFRINALRAGLHLPSGEQPA